jgi:AmpE protein
MTYLLLAAIIVLILGHYARDLARLRRYDAFATWLELLARRLPEGWRQSPYSLLLGVGAPVAVVALLHAALGDPLGGLFAFVIAVAALFYVWGPRDLDQDVNAIADVAPAEQPAQATVRLDVADTPLTGAAMAGALGRAAQRRWFGPLFWFVVLGPAGAVLYRLAQLAAESDVESLSDNQRATATRLLAILDWPVAHLMALGMAIATDFDTVAQVWRRRTQAAGGAFAFDAGLVAEVTAVAVKADLEEADNHETDGFDEATVIDRGPVLRDALAVMWRVLIVWLAIIALAALASLFA